MVLAVALSGCHNQPAGPPRGAVHGTVTLDGKPIARGTIDFAPTDPTAGPASGLPLQDGRYASEAKGAVVGKSRVEIRAPRDSNQPRGDGDGKRNYVEAIPARYNAQTTLEVDVQAGDNTFDFALKSR